ncbi:MAG: HAD family hydrolase [Thiohalomonadales bacterium]
MSLVIFDLDNTLIAGDSDHLWGEFLVEQGLVDENHYRIHNDKFYQDYKDGCLDIQAFLRFSLFPLTQYSIQRLNALREEFVQQKILPIILPDAQKLVDHHRNNGQTLMIITATNRFVTAPIAQIFQIPHLLATEPEINTRGYTGKIVGEPCFKEGKIVNLNRWLKSDQVDLDDSWFYSDSYNDLPLLELVTHPIAVDPDERLRIHAQQQNWKIISLRTTKN